VVPHDILLRKLTGLVIDKRVVSWIQYFLDGQTQRVKIGNEMSDFGNVTSGVPQGSAIGLLLFLIFINDLTSNIRSKVRLFADDCIIYRVICDEHDINAMQTDLDEIAKWLCKIE
jgi:tetrahydromethanopterin S-methyltransferase subunit G